MGTQSDTGRAPKVLILIQLNLAITDFKGPTIFIHYRRISAIANTGIKGEILQGTEKMRDSTVLIEVIKAPL